MTEKNLDAIPITRFWCTGISVNQFSMEIQGFDKKHRTRNDQFQIFRSTTSYLCCIELFIEFLIEHRKGEVYGKY
jgi:hypothetical protein